MTGTETIRFQFSPEEIRHIRQSLADRFGLDNGFTIISLVCALAPWPVLGFVHLALPPYQQGAIGIVSGTVLFFVAFGVRRAIAFRPYSMSAAAAGMTTVRFTESDLDVQGPKLALRSAWRSIRNIDETPHWFILFVPGYRAVVLPKRAIPPQVTEQLQALRARREQQVAREFALWGRRFPWG